MNQENKIMLLTLICIGLLIFVLVGLYYSVIFRNNSLYESKPSNIQSPHFVPFSKNKPQTMGNQISVNDSPYVPLPPSSVQSIPTRGTPTNFTKIGVLVNDDKSKILPLYSRTLFSNSNKYNYYTKTDGFQSESLPVRINERDCTDPEVGCVEVYSGDNVYVNELGQKFTAEIYKKDSFVYNPHG